VVPKFFSTFFADAASYTTRQDDMRKSEVAMAALLDNKVLQARVYCPICTHTVEADAVAVERGLQRKIKVLEGQRCRRCQATLDAAYVLEVKGGLHG